MHHIDAMFRSLLLAVALTTPVWGGAPWVGPVLDYRFDRDPGAVAGDFSGQHHDGTIVHGVWMAEAAGRKGVLRLAGNDSYIDCGELSRLGIHGDATFEMWVRENGPGQGAWSFLFGQSPIDSFHLSLAYQHSLVFYYRSGPGESLLLPAPRQLLDMQWAHLAVVVAYPRCRFYRDGQLMRDVEMSAPGLIATDKGKFTIGGGPGENERCASIDLSAFRVYARALASDEVAADALDVPPPERLAAELTLQSDWYAETVTLRLEQRGASVSADRVIFHVADSTEPSRVQEIATSWAETTPGSHRYCAVTKLPLSDWKGRTMKVAALSEGDGSELAHTVSRLDKPAWIKTGEGISGKVLAPWSPVSAHSDAAHSVDIGVWNRRYTFGGGLFPQQIESGGHKLLAGAISLRAVVNGEARDWSRATATLRESNDVAATVVTQGDAGPLSTRVEGRVEYDGYAIFDCEITATAAVEVKNLALEIPLQSAYAKLCYGTDVLPVTGGDPLTAIYSGAVRGPLAFKFSPNIALTDEDRGLCWQAESDADWNPENPLKAIEIRPENGVTYFVAHWVDASLHLQAGQKLHYRFALLGLPVKPLLRDSWKLRIARSEPYGRDLTLPDRQVDGIPMLQRYAEEGIRALYISTIDTWPWPMPSHETFSQPLHRLIAAAHAEGLKVEPYLIHQRFPVSVPEFDGYGPQIGVRPFKQYVPDAGPPERPGMVAFAYGADSQADMFFCPESPAAQDAWIHSLAQRLKDYDDDGVYLDGTVHIVPCENEAHGCGYVKDGRRHVTYPVFAVREFMRRIYTVVKEHNPDGLVDVHCSWGYNPGGLAYADMMWTGEQWYRYRKTGAPFIPDALTLDKFRTEFTGRQVGIAADTLTYRLGKPMKVAAISLLHDISPRMSTTDRDSLTHESDPYNSLVPKIWALREAFDAEHGTPLFYWNNHDYVQVDTPDCYATLLRHPRNGVLALVSNLSHQAGPVAVRLGMDALGWSDVRLEAVDPLSGQKVAIDALGRFSLNLPSVGWEYVLIRPAAGTPEAVPPLVLPLNPKPATTVGPETWEKGDSIGNVSEPAVEVHLPTRVRATGLAFIVCPGGSYTKVGRISTGVGLVAEWNPRGAAVIVLKYRTKPPSTQVEADALADLNSALRLVQGHAVEWKIDPKRIGLVGGSAGSNLILNFLSHSPEAKSVAFAALLCPWPDGKTMASYPISQGSPPLFIASALDDMIAPHAFAVSLQAACAQAGVPAELWTVSRGGHTAFSPGQHGEGAAWPMHFERWLSARGIDSSNARN